jgi:uncharacterized NAD(P)/FAD-binding protein YdhS
VTTVAVVGLGSRGLGVLERIVTLAKRRGPAAGPVRVEVVDPTCSGAGVHDRGQPDYLLLNTTCGQVSMFPDAATVGDEVDAPGPSLHEWVTARGLRLASDGFTVGTEGRPIRPTDFLPRRVLGDYLAWVLGEVLRRAPSHVDIRLHRAEAVDLDRGPGGLTVTLSTGGRIAADHAFLTTGYTANTVVDLTPDGPRRTTGPYPLPERVAAVEPGQVAAIGGFGLSAMDVMSCLTVGRGGRFAEDAGSDGGLRYLPSGREPALLFLSRTGLPCRARPHTVEFGPPYRPVAFTTAAVDAVRRARGGPLDFDADVLPLVLTEIRVAYRRCQARLAGAAATAALEADLAADVAGTLDRLDAERDRFDAAEALAGSAGMALDGPEAYQKWLAETIRADLAEGLLGFAGSPVKAGLDVLRALRDTFRYVVDFGGLTTASLDAFTCRTVPALNRAVVGPQWERHAELLALLAAGVARAPFGPEPVATWDGGMWTVSSTRLAEPYAAEVDWVIAAHVELPAVRDSASPLIAALHRRGTIRSHRPDSRWVRGIDVDRDQHPVDATGRPEPRLRVLGPLCEGATFYNNLVPSPNVHSRPVHDAHRCVRAILG